MVLSDCMEIPSWKTKTPVGFGIQTEPEVAEQPIQYPIWLPLM